MPITCTFALTKTLLTFFELLACTNFTAFAAIDLHVGRILFTLSISSPVWTMLVEVRAVGWLVTGRWKGEGNGWKCDRCKDQVDTKEKRVESFNDLNKMTYTEYNCYIRSSFVLKPKISFCRITCKVKSMNQFRLHAFYAKNIHCLQIIK